MKRKKVEVIKQEGSNKKCYICKGKGSTNNKKCKRCEGTGIFKDNHYIMIADKMAFHIDTIK